MNSARYALLCTLLIAAVCSAACEPRQSTPGVRFTRVVEGSLVTDAASTGGVSWVDIDNDGDLDLFVTNGYDVSQEKPEPQKNRVYLNNGGGGFTAVEQGPLATDDGFSSGSTWGDIDNDGDLDAFVSNQQDQDNFLYLGNGDGTFQKVEAGDAVEDGGHSYSASWVDVDNDGLLDLSVANGGLSHSGPNFLYRNLGDGALARVEEGELVTDDARSGGAVWGDYDDDGDLDLFVSNITYGGAPNNALYRNEGDWRFTKITEGLLVEDGLPAVCAAWGDYDNDADLDLYVGVLFGWANMLYRNEGDGRFSRVTEGPAVTDGGATYGVNWADVDNDTDLDLLVVNWGAAPILYLNRGDGQLERAAAGDLGLSIGYGSSVAWGDYDTDGDLDVYIGAWPNLPGPGELNLLYRNDTEGAHWLGVKLVGTRSNHSGIGARIVARARIHGEPRSQIREVTAHSGWRSQNSLLQHFGLADATVLDELEVRWPSGTVDRLTDLPADQIIEVTEGQSSS